MPLRVAGVALLAAGVVVLVQAFVRFVVEGVGTPAPVAPTQRLVVGGPFVRPLACIAGQQQGRWVRHSSWTHTAA
jgi:hypothetical protein